MASTREFDGVLLVDAATGALVGAKGADGREYLFPTVVNANAAASQPSAVFSSAMAITGGTADNLSIGATTRNAGRFSSLTINSLDSSGTPGNVTNNNPNGRAAFAAAGTTVVVTNSLCAAGDTVLVTLFGPADATLTTINVTAVAAGSFTVVGNAAATAAKTFMWTLVKQ